MDIDQLFQHLNKYVKNLQKLYYMDALYRTKEEGDSGLIDHGGVRRSVGNLQEELKRLLGTKSTEGGRVSTGIPQTLPGFMKEAESALRSWRYHWGEGGVNPFGGHYIKAAEGQMRKSGLAPTIGSLMERYTEGAKGNILESSPMGRFAQSAMGLMEQYAESHRARSRKSRVQRSREKKGFGNVLGGLVKPLMGAAAGGGLGKLFGGNLLMDEENFEDAYRMFMNSFGYFW